MVDEKGMEQSDALLAASTKSACMKLLALAEDCRKALVQVLELLQQYYHADRAVFLECEEPETVTGENTPEDKQRELITAAVQYGENCYGILQIRHAQLKNRDPKLVAEVAQVLAAEIGKQEKQEYLLRLCYLDQLTGIRNNTSYIQSLKSLMKKTGKSLGVAFADLNGLKYLNDTFGHEYGDRALKHLAEVCREYFAKEQLFRISGDEFVVLCPDIDRKEFIKQAERLKERLMHQEKELAAFGYLWNDGTVSADELIHKAERLMYEEKQLHYRDGMRRVQECPQYAGQLILRDQTEA